MQTLQTGMKQPKKWNTNAKSQIQEKGAANKWKKSKQKKKTLNAAKHADA